MNIVLHESAFERLNRIVDRIGISKRAALEQLLDEADEHVAKISGNAKAFYINKGRLTPDTQGQRD